MIGFGCKHMKKTEPDWLPRGQSDKPNEDDSGITLYTAKDIQRIFHCGKNKAYEIMHMHGFPSFRINSAIYVEKNELKKWIASVKNRSVLT